MGFPLEVGWNREELVPILIDDSRYRDGFFI